RREPMQIVDIVGEEVGPFQPLPLPDRRVDVDAASARHLARACAVRSVDTIGNRVALAHRAPLACPCRGPARRRDGQALRWNLPRRAAAYWARRGTFPDAFR